MEHLKTISPHIEYFIEYSQRDFCELGNACLKSVPSEVENCVNHNKMERHKMKTFGAAFAAPFGG